MVESKEEPMQTEETTTKKKGMDHTELEAQIATLKSDSKGNLDATLEKLLNLEKTNRLGGDAIATELLCVAIVQCCYEARAYKQLNEHIILLSKRRSQLKQAIVGMVQESMSYIDKLADINIKTELISTLSTVTTGKIYVEVERARLTRQLAKIKESQGKVDEAAEIMQEVAVETFGAMAKTEKVAFILEQVRLCLEKKDFIRANILNKKISPRTFVEKEVKEKKATAATMDQNAPPEQPAAEGTPSLPELKLMYYDLSITIAKQDNQYLEVCRGYQSIFQDKNVAEDATRWGPVLKKICWYAVLAPHGSEQSSMLHTINEDKKLQDMPLYAALIKQFITMEVIRWTLFTSTYAGELEAEDSVFGGEAGAARRKDLQERVVQHNILVICKYYSRLTLTRLAQLLDLSPADAEDHLSRMVVSKTIDAKLDRPSGIVKCKAKLDAAQLLNGWFSNIDRVLSLVEQSTHQIHKECMLHKVPIGMP